MDKVITLRCTKCRRHYESLGGKQKICPLCREEEEKEYRTVREYIRSHNKVSIFEVSKATGIQEKKILQFIRQGLIEVSRESKLIPCKSCGTLIVSGLYCENCRRPYENRLLDEIVDKKKN